MSFGKWYQEQKAADNLEAAEGGMNFGGIEMNSLISNITPQEMISFAAMKESLEAQLPQKICGMNYQQRFQMFVALLALSALFFLMAFTVGLTFISLRPQKFALSFTCGSLLFMASFGILKGPWAHLSGMLTLERLPFTLVYVVSMLATLYATFSFGGASGYVMVLSASAFQLLSLLWYLITFLPGGAAGMQFLTAALMKLLGPLVTGCIKCQALCFTKLMGFVFSSSSSSSS